MTQAVTKNSLLKISFSPMIRNDPQILTLVLGKWSLENGRVDEDGENQEEETDHRHHTVEGFDRRLYDRFENHLRAAENPDHFHRPEGSQGAQNLYRWKLTFL